jgi:hypothetical protein
MSTINSWISEVTSNIARTLTPKLGGIKADGVTNRAETVFDVFSDLNWKGTIELFLFVSLQKKLRSETARSAWVKKRHETNGTLSNEANHQWSVR